MYVCTIFCYFVCISQDGGGPWSTIIHYIIFCGPTIIHYFLHGPDEGVCRPPPGSAPHIGSFVAYIFLLYTTKTSKQIIFMVISFSLSYQVMAEPNTYQHQMYQIRLLQDKPLDLCRLLCVLHALLVPFFQMLPPLQLSITLSKIFLDAYFL